MHPSFLFLFLLGVLSFSWSDYPSGSYQSDNANFRTNDGSSTRDKWTFRKAFNGGTLFRFWKIHSYFDYFTKLRDQGWKDATKWESFLFLFSLPHLWTGALHFWLLILPSFMSMIHLFYSILLPLVVPSPLPLFDLHLVLLKDIQCREITKRGEYIIFPSFGTLLRWCFLIFMSIV